jgi:ATP-dependent DNA ligase
VDYVISNIADPNRLSGSLQARLRGIVSKRLGSFYRSGRLPHWLKVKNPQASAVRREAEED